MKRQLCGALAVVALLAASSALASYHTWRIQEIFSNADGTIQFVVLHESAGDDGENLLSGHTLTATEGTTTRTYTFQRDLPGGSCDYYGGCTPAPTANRYVLIGTNSFKALGLVMPDYVIPDGFVPLAGSVQYAEFPAVTYGSLPIDGKSAIDATGAVIPNLATNYFGVSASVVAASANYQGLWWAAPANSEAGWGINFAHQQDTIFASWFTYDLQGRGTWLVMIADKTDTNKYEGDLLETHGPPFNSQPFPPTATNVKVGTGQLRFTDVNTGDFDYTITSLHGVAIAPIPGSKHIIRQVFGTVPTCSYGTGANLAAATNYQDLWWAKPAASESGWGINLNHESDTIFATWFTYDLSGAPLWLVSVTNKDSPGVYKGRLLLTSGPTVNASPWPVVRFGRRRQRDVHLCRRQQRDLRLHGAAAWHADADHAAETDHPATLLAARHYLPVVAPGASAGCGSFRRTRGYGSLAGRHVRGRRDPRGILHHRSKPTYCMNQPWLTISD